MKPVLWITDPSLRAPSERLASSRFTDGDAVVVRSADELRAATRGAAETETVSFVDPAAFGALDRTDVQPPGPIIAICNEPLATAIGWLRPHPWLSHVVSASLLALPLADELLGNVVRSLVASDAPRLLDWLGPDVAGRRVRLVHSSRRADRLEKMGEYLEANGVGPRTTQQLRDAAEELLTNAFYDAPVAAGAVKRAIPRTQDVSLPEKEAADLAYGCRDDLAIVRVRDPFGSLSRRRLVQVLTRCAHPDREVKVDETMGGAGLGMWRIFSVASFVAISVVKHCYTEILVGIAKRSVPGTRPYAFHLFFRDGRHRPPKWRSDTERSTLVFRSREP